MHKTISDGIKNLKTGTLLLYVGLFIVSSLCLGTLLRFVVENISASIGGTGLHFRVGLLVEWQTWSLGGVVSLLLAAL
ncbi:MAG: hypothetical protein IJQ98_01125, partial [Oscillospiraceae bacterium]|nr:hypothetical protein [Oscillospiraceae bacterium]